MRNFGYPHMAASHRWVEHTFLKDCRHSAGVLILHMRTHCGSWSSEQYCDNRASSRKPESVTYHLMRWPSAMPPDLSCIRLRRAMQACSGEGHWHHFHHSQLQGNLGRPCIEYRSLLLRPQPQMAGQLVDTFDASSTSSLKPTHPIIASRAVQPGSRVQLRRASEKESDRRGKR
jgi:hypothetical protein